MKFQGRSNLQVKTRWTRPKTSLNGCQTQTVYVTIMIGLGWCLHRAHRRAIEEVSKTVNLDWVKHQACRLSPYICIITYLFISNYYLLKDLGKSFYRFFSDFIHQVAIKFKFQKALLSKGFPSDIIFLYTKSKCRQ